MSDTHLAITASSLVMLNFSTEKMLPRTRVKRPLRLLRMVTLLTEVWARAMLMVTLAANLWYTEERESRTFHHTSAMGRRCEATYARALRTRLCRTSTLVPRFDES